MIILTDDGTSDTVVKCTECNEKFRFNFSYNGYDTILNSYEDFVEECIRDTENDHICPDPTMDNMTKEQRALLIEGIQFIGFALTENMPKELEAVTAIEDALIRGNWSDLQRIMHEDYA